MMPAQISTQEQREIVRMRALDHTKQEIADQLDISRNTVTRHLKEIREDIESENSPNIGLALFLFNKDDLIDYVSGQSEDVLEDVDKNIKLLAELAGSLNK
jgi:transcriptional antiterminator